MFSNKKKLFYSALLLLLFNVSLIAQEEPDQKQSFDSINQLVTNAMISINAHLLSKTFHDKIDLTLSDNQGIYSNSQAQYIISSFFKKYPILSYQIVSQNNTFNSNFVVGIMHTADQKFKVCYLIKQENNTPKIYQFRIEK